MKQDLEEQKARLAKLEEWASEALKDYICDCGVPHIPTETANAKGSVPEIEFHGKSQ